MMRLAKFAGASGLGLLLDYAVYTVLCEAGLAAGVANLISASVGVTFVFLVSAHRIFDSSDHFLLRLFVIYAVYQVVAIVAASWLVDTMTGVFDGRYLLGKTVVLPLTFGANYLFTSWLFTARRREAVPA
jgi:putative flippase GtrA